MKYIISSLLLLFAVGCATVDYDKTLRSGLADLDNDQYRNAEKKAKSILKHNPQNHAAQLLKVRSVVQVNPTIAVQEAVKADRTCPADVCIDPQSHLDLLYLLVALTNDEETLKRAKIKTSDLQRQISIKKHSSLAQFYAKQGRPRESALEFDLLSEACNGELTSDQKLFGYLLYDSLFETEKAKKLYDQLSPRQKAIIQTKGSD